MAPRKPKDWQPPAGLRVEVIISRGDATLKADATVSEALNVARLLTAMVRQLTKDAPDLLPLADNVHGSTMPYFEDDWADEGKRTIGYVKGTR